MFVPGSFTVALLMTVLSAVFWGSWANTYKGTKGYRFELFYWDYAVGVMIICFGLALTMGSVGSTGEGFVANLRAADSSNVLYALIAGFILLSTGTGPVRGFATSLIIGLVASLFTSIVVTRAITTYFVHGRGAQTVSV